MKQMTDCHTHTSISPDGRDTVLAGAVKASDIGLKAYAVTEHCEANRLYGSENCPYTYNEEHYFNNLEIFERSMTANIQTAEKISGRINFINGIELGQATHNFSDAEIIADDERLDFIIGSMHELPGKEDFAFLDYKNEDIDSVLSDYFDELIKLCEWGKFDTLGHLTYPLRYIVGENHINADISSCEEKIRKIFTLLSRNDKGLEINTSGLRQLYGKTFPELKYIKMFRECGGKIITVGSDSHCTDDIGKGIIEGIALAKEAGFEKIYYFKKHIPYGISI